jgi:DNA-binding beta-propeller fold protein YncE
LFAPTHARALCADVSGDGYVTASDALGVGRLAVAAPYDARADVFPAAEFDDAVSASDARVVLQAAASHTIPRCAAATEHTVVLTTASCDFVTGGVAAIDVASRAVLFHHPAVSEADAVVRNRGGRVFVLNRSGSNTVMELDPANDLAVKWQCSVGMGLNPHDIALVSSNKAYVTRHDSPKLAIVDPSKGPGGCGGFLQGTIDLSPWADDDGFPEMDQLLLVGDELFVSILRLNRDSFFRPNGNGAILVIDTKTDEVVDAIELVIENPLVETKGLHLDRHTGLIWISGPGLFFDPNDGGIEIVDPQARASLGVVATGADLGGDPTDLVVVGSSRAYAIVATADNHVQLVEINLAAHERVALLAENETQMSDVEMTEDGELWLADRECPNPGVRVFSIADNDELTTEPIYPGLGPFSLEFLR